MNLHPSILGHPGVPGSVECAGLSPFHLTPAQIADFDSLGYLILRNWIPQALLQRLQAAGQRWIEQAQASGGATVAGSAQVGDIVSADFNFAQRSGGRRVPFRVNYLHDKGDPASLELLGSPQVLGVAESLCGPNFVPTYESMVFKMTGDGEVVAWHQDAVFPRRYRVFNFDLYLDRSSHHAGALRVLPGSQTRQHDVCAFARDWGWNHPEQIVVEMNPGDVLLHDDMVLHGSPPTEGNALRRTIYFEFRPLEQILEEGPWDPSFADQRLRLVPLGLRRYREANPGAPEFQWRLDASHRPDLTGDEAVELRIAHRVHTSGSYCSASSK